MSDLVASLAAQIASHIRFERLPGDTHLPERTLAERFHVSRSPVREALRLLAFRGAVRYEKGRGFLTIGDIDEALSEELLADETDGDLYEQLADDHLTAAIPERSSENALIRRYGAAPSAIKRVLTRAAQEGWAERLPGHGWRFLPVLRSMESYEQSYRFRMLIEPAGILEQGFTLDAASLSRVRAEQQSLLDADRDRLSAQMLFEAGVRAHEAVMECSGNAFFIDGLRRANQLRRLVAYRRITPQWVTNCESHIKIIDLLTAGERGAAADFMREHLIASLEGSRTTVKKIA